MAFSAVITLTTAGADTGPFNLYTDIDGFVTPFETGVGKAALEAGYLSSLVPDGSLVVRVKSASLFCTNYINLALPTTTTSSTTAAPTLASIFVNNTNSLDIPITDITVNGVMVSFVSGTDFTVSAGNNGNFETDEIGTYDILVYYGGHIPGQNIAITDSANNVFCCDLNGSAGSCNFIGAVINTSQTVQVVVSDGACS